ncbi:MAG: Hint domain-containing protein [Myxococcaceae bacterium]|nr:Hint domain-containing protein [Myxococcaceae bacterium]
MALVSAHREVGAITFGSHTLEVTSDHPVFDPDTGAFHDAGDWLLGKRRRLLRAEGSRLEAVAVTATKAFARLTTVFDLTVEHEWHTFVANGVVVHNKSIARSCLPTDGGAAVFDGATCTCDGTSTSTGVWSCFPGEAGSCVGCEDGRDGGLVDGGVP